MSDQAKIDKIVDELSALSLLDAVELVKVLEEKWGVSAVAPVMAQAVASGSEADAGAAEEKTEFNVVLKSTGTSKINVIKAIRSFTELGLKEAKELVESAPKSVKEGVSKEEADKMVKALVDAGAEAEVE